MRSVDVIFKSTNEDPKVEQFTVSIERQRDVDRWDLMGRNPNITSGPDGTKTYMLEVGERLIIEPSGAAVEMVFDKEQNAVMPREAFESQPSAADKQKIEEDRQKELREKTFGATRTEREVEQAASRARDEVLTKQAEREAQRAKELRAKEDTTPNTGAKGTDKAPAPATSTPQGAPQSPAAATQSPAPGTVTSPGTNATQAKGGMTAPGPSTGGQSSKDVK
jgi:hypothetical protein